MSDMPFGVEFSQVLAACSSLDNLVLLVELQVARCKLMKYYSRVVCKVPRRISMSSDAKVV
jgi:hypothetical protein